MSNTGSDNVNSSHYFELLDRTHIASSYLQMALGQHAVLAKHPELKALYEAAVDRLEELYQAVGRYDETWNESLG